MFTTTETLLPIILGIVAFALWVQKFKFFKNIGPAMTVVILGIIFMNTGIVPGWADIYGTIVTYCVPVATSLYLLSMDISQLKKMSKQPWIAMGCAIVCVALLSTVFGLVFSGALDEGWKIAGMFVGTYTGGSSNLTAIAIGLQASESTIGAANAADYVVGMPTMLLMFAAPAILGRSKWFQKVWPYRFSEAEYKDGEDSQSPMEQTGFGVKDIAILLTIAFSIVAVSTFIAGAIFPDSFASAGRILLITTFSLIAAQIPGVKKLKGQFSIGLFLSLLYLVIIGFMVDIRGFLGSTLTITLFCLCVIFGSILLHLILMRLFKIKYEYAVLSITAGIADGTTAALVAAGGGWKNLVPVGILMGLIGGLAGNYIGIGVGYLIRAIVGG